MEVKIKSRQLSELETCTKVSIKYSKLSITEALGSPKRRLTALPTYLKRYTRDAEAQRISRMFTIEPSIV